MPSLFSINNNNNKQQQKGPGKEQTGPKLGSPPNLQDNYRDLEDQSYDVENNGIFGEHKDYYYHSWLPVFLVTCIAVIVIIMVTLFALQYVSFDDLESSDPEDAFITDAPALMCSDEMIKLRDGKFVCE